VFYCDFGNGEALHLNRMRALDPSLMSLPPLAHLCTLAYIKVPDLPKKNGLSLTPSHSLTHSLTFSLTRPLSHSFTHSRTHSLTLSHTLSLTQVPDLDADYGIQAATCLAQHANGRALPAGPYTPSLLSSS